MNIQFGSFIPSTLPLDSTLERKAFYSFDKAVHVEKEYRFKAHSFGFDANYYVFTLDDHVHLININYQRIDSMQAQQVMDSLSTLLLPIHFDRGPESFYFKDEFCTTFNWVKFNPYKKELIFQLSDAYYCDRLEF